MDRIRFDLRYLDNIDVQRQGQPLRRAPMRRNLYHTEKKALKNSFEFLKLFHRWGSILMYIFEITEHPPILDILRPQQIDIGLHPARKSNAITLAEGLSESAFSGIGIGISGGFYGSSTGELGIFSGGSIGIWTNIGISASIMVTYILGPPSDLGGVSWGVGCDIGGEFIGGGGMLLFSPPPIRFLGVSFSIGVGMSTLPFDITVQAGYTKTKPLLYLR